MDALPLEIHCEIMSYLDTSQLLVCRLVSRYWEEIVSCHLAKVDHAILNQTLDDDSPIPDILFDHLHCMRFPYDLSRTNRYRSLLDFLRKKCPNLKVFSAVNEVIDVQDFIRLPPGLMYFNAAFLWDEEQLFPFPSLIACESGFCTVCRSPSSVKYSTNCRDHLVQSDHPNVNTLTTEKLKTLRWFHYEGYSHSNLVSKLFDCPSLEILYLQCAEEHLSFSYPKLKFLKIFYFDASSPTFLRSLRHSTQLRAIDIDYLGTAAPFLEFTASLEHLQFLKVGRVSDRAVSVHLNDSLRYFHFCSLKTSLILTGTNHSKLQVFYIQCKLDDSIPSSSFNLPCLKFAELYFYHATVFADRMIDSLFHSTILCQLNVESICPPYSLTAAHARKLLKFISDTVSLRNVLFNIQLPDAPNEEDELFIVDISRHHHLDKLALSLRYLRVYVRMNIVIGDCYDDLYTDLKSFVLKKKGINYRSCYLTFPVRTTSFVPVFPNSLPFTKFEMILVHHFFVGYNIGQVSLLEAVEIFDQLTSNMPGLKDLSFNTVDGVNIPFETAMSLHKCIENIPSLESLQFVLSING